MHMFDGNSSYYPTCPFCPAEHKSYLFLTSPPPPWCSFFPLPSAYQYPDHSLGLSLRSFLHESFSHLSLTSLNFCSQIIGIMFRVNAFVCVGFPSTALLWKFWMKCLTIHISSLPSACPDLAQQVHRTLCQCCEEDVAATRQPLKSGLFVPLSLHLNLLLGMLSSSSTSLCSPGRSNNLSFKQ